MNAVLVVLFLAVLGVDVCVCVIPGCFCVIDMCMFVCVFVLACLCVLR